MNHYKIYYVLHLVLCTTTTDAWIDTDAQPYSEVTPSVIIMQAIDNIAQDDTYAFLLDYAQQSNNEDFKELYDYVKQFNNDLQRSDSFLVHNKAKMVVLSIFFWGLSCLTYNLFEYYLPSKILPIEPYIRSYNYKKRAPNPELAERERYDDFCQMYGIYGHLFFFVPLALGIGSMTGSILGYAMNYNGIEGKVDTKKLNRIDNLISILNERLLVIALGKQHA